MKKAFAATSIWVLLIATAVGSMQIKAVLSYPLPDCITATVEHPRGIIRNNTVGLEFTVLNACGELSNGRYYFFTLDKLTVNNGSTVVFTEYPITVLYSKWEPRSDLLSADLRQIRQTVLPNPHPYSSSNTYTVYTIKGNATLSGLADGKHYVTIYYGPTYSSTTAYQALCTAYFTVDVAPKISLRSFTRRVFNFSDVPLDFVVNKAVSKLAYSLDGQERIGISGNTTVTVSNGAHNVTVYAWDDDGNLGESETITFTVNEPEPFPKTLVSAIVVLVSVVTVAAGFLFYLRNRRH